jgi:hypothetical protein
MSAQGFIHTAHLVRPLVIDRVEEIVPAILSAAAVPANGQDAEVIAKL